jgi:uncharacterized protein (TIGR00369 family)
VSAQSMRENIARAEAAWHRRCIACSGRNPYGLHLDFVPQKDGAIEAAFACDVVFSGYDGRLHGGVVAMLLDAAMTHCMFARGLAGVTGELRVRFLRPVGVAVPARIRARLEKSTHWLHLVRSEILQDAAVRASAVGRFMERPTDAAQEGMPEGTR